MQQKYFEGSKVQTERVGVVVCKASEERRERAEGGEDSLFI